MRLAERSARRASTLTGLVLAAGVLSACGGDPDSGSPVSDLRMPDNHGYHATWLDEPFPVADVSLTDTVGSGGGSAHSLKQDAGKPLTVVFFGYSSCPDVCQVVMSTIASAYARLDSAQKKQVDVDFVTTDPERDTVPALRRYLDRFDPAFVGLTGPIDRVDAAGRPFGIYVKKGAPLPSGGYDVQHTTSVIGLHDGVGRLVWSSSTSPADMAADMSRMLRSAT